MNPLQLRLGFSYRPVKRNLIAKWLVRTPKNSSKFWSIEGLVNLSEVSVLNYYSLYSHFYPLLLIRTLPITLTLLLTLLFILLVLILKLTLILTLTSILLPTLILLLTLTFMLLLLSLPEALSPPAREPSRAATDGCKPDASRPCTRPADEHFSPALLSSFSRPR